VAQKSSLVAWPGRKLNGWRSRAVACVSARLVFVRTFQNNGGLDGKEGVADRLHR
jgi:hypothetical protein